LLLAWDTLLPLTGRFPVTWHTLDIALHLWKKARLQREGRILYQKACRDTSRAGADRGEIFQAFQ
jgi:hypothetical protein